MRSLSDFTRKQSALASVAFALFSSTIAVAKTPTALTPEALRALEPPPGMTSGTAAPIPRISIDDVFWSDEFGPNGLGMNGLVWGLYADEGTLYAGGEFTTAGGIPANRVAAFNGESWSPLGSGTNGRVFSFATYDGDLIVGGEFWSAGNVAGTVGIARWDGTAWHSLGGGLSGPVRSLLVHDGELIVGGDFDVAGTTTAHKVAVWDGESWSRMGPGFGGGYNDLGVRGLDVLHNTIYAAGHFTYSGSQSLNYIARWTGNQWSPVDGGLPAAGYAFFVRGQRLIAGSVVWFDGLGSWKDVLMRWPPWRPLGVGALSAPYPNAGRIFTIRGGRLIAGGQFPVAAGEPVNYLAKWDGEIWEPFGSGLNAPTYALANFKGSLYVGGEFTAAGNKPSSRIARWDAPPDEDLNVQNLAAISNQSGTTVSWQLNEEMIDRAVSITVERSVSGGSYLALAPGASEPSSGMQLVDATSPSGPCSYRLRIELINGPLIHTQPVLPRAVLDRNGPDTFDPPQTDDGGSVRFAFRSTGSSQQARARVFNARGQLVRTVVDGMFPAGNHTVTWDRRDASGNRVRRGVYFATYELDGIGATYKMVLAD